MASCFAFHSPVEPRLDRNLINPIRTLLIWLMPNAICLQGGGCESAASEPLSEATGLWSAIVNRNIRFQQDRDEGGQGCFGRRHTCGPQADVQTHCGVRGRGFKAMRRWDQTLLFQ